MSQLFTSGGQSIGASSLASSQYSGRISIRVDWFAILAVRGALKSLCQHQVFSSESVLHIRWPSIGVSASASVPQMNVWD